VPQLTIHTTQAQVNSMTPLPADLAPISSSIAPMDYTKVPQIDLDPDQGTSLVN
jgi:hypothetical protein